MSAQNKEKLLSLKFSNIALSEAMTKIEKAGGYTFFYDAEQVNVSRKVSLNVADATIRQTMDALLKSTDLAYEVSSTQIALFPKQTATAPGKEITINGTVVDELGEPVIGANILVAGTSHGTITDVDGHYTLTVPAASMLKVSYVGYTDLLVKASNASLIKLKEDTAMLTEVVVVGYGSMKKSDLTGGVVSVGEEKLNLSSNNNLVDRLAGLMPGLSINVGNARPGEKQSLSVRGNTSLSASNAPLIVLDGIPYSGSLIDIDPDMVESMSVLKDASSAAIYGSRGSNGVILVQTKKGKGKAKITYKGQVGVVQPEHRLNMMKGAEYLGYLRDVIYMSNRDKNDASKFLLNYDDLTPEKLLGQEEYANYKAGIETDWQDIIFRTTLNTSHQVSLSGSSEKTTYIASISHLLQDGVMRNTGMQRTNVSLNITQELGDIIKVGLNLQGVRRDTGGLQPAIEDGLKMSPFGEYRHADGTLNFTPMQRDNLFKNPMRDVKAVSDKLSHNIILSSFVDVKLPVKGLKYRTNFGYNYRNSFQGTYYGRNTYTGLNNEGYASIYNGQYHDYTWENLLFYTREFGKHKIDATGLFSAAQTYSESSEMSASSFVSDASAYHQIQLGEKSLSIKSDLTETALLSYMFRLNYGFAGKYMATFTFRSDGASNFGKNNKWAYFPSAALAWNMAEEHLFDNTRDWLDMLKLRLSYGANGNQAISAYQTLDRLTTVKYLYGDGMDTVNGVFMNYNGRGNPNLKWETTYTFNAGVDFSFLNGRLNGNIDFYVANTKDLLRSRSIPMMNGYRSILDNVGRIRNIGVEIALNSANIRTKEFSWNTNYNFSLNRNQITELADGVKEDLTNHWFVGKPASLYYDYNMVGVWQLNDPRWKEVKGKWGYYTENAKGQMVEIQKGAQPGSAMLEDVNGDGVINKNDRKIIGSKLPSFQMGMTNSFTYKEFYASFVMNGTFGKWRQVHEESFDRWMRNFNYISDMGYWTPTNPTNEMTSPDYSPFEKHSFYKKMSYVELRNITVGYNLPKQWIKSLGMESLRVDVSMNNVCSFSNFKNVLNFDNALTNQDEKGTIVGYPTARSYMLGVNLAF
jgi:TonB-linked SusC/RagA family outer membrane protein